MSQSQRWLMPFDDEEAADERPDGNAGPTVARGPTGSSNGAVNKKRVLEILERQGRCCALTGRTLTPQTASIDHITPLANGGSHTIGNIQILHKDVNAAKGSMSQEEFIEMCREVARFLDGTETI